MELHRKKDGFKKEKLLVLPRDIITVSSKHPLVKNLYITDIGFFPQAKDHYIERKKGSEENILIYCTNGEGFVIVEDKRHTISKNSLIIIPQNMRHIYGSSSEKPWDIFWIHFKGELEQNYLQSKDSLVLVNVPLSNFSTLSNLFHNMFDALSRGYTINNIIFANQCFGFFLASIFYMPFNKYEHKDKHIKYVESSIDFMEKNLDKVLTLGDLKAFNGLSKSQLTEVFKEKTGYSPIDFFIRLKIQKACSYLDLTELIISDISSKLGYSDQYYFSRIFKKIMGMSPVNYRKIKKG